MQVSNYDFNLFFSFLGIFLLFLPLLLLRFLLPPFWAAAPEGTGGDASPVQ